MLMTGLYENINSIQNNKSLTFLSRIPKLILKPLNMPAIKDSYEEIFNIDSDTAIKMSKLTEGYAYAYQVLGYLMWEEGNKKISKKLLSQFDQCRLAFYMKLITNNIIKINEGLFILF